MLQNTIYDYDIVIAFWNDIFFIRDRHMNYDVSGVLL